jgi:hypothetical protein
MDAVYTGLTVAVVGVIIVWLVPRARQGNTQPPRSYYVVSLVLIGGGAAAAAALAAGRPIVAIALLIGLQLSLLVRSILASRRNR